MQSRRQAAGMTQRKVAQTLGVDVVTVSRWETGTRVPSVEKLKELARLYGCTVDELIDEVQEEEGGHHDD